MELAQTDASRALAKELKRRGWSFVGPTTVYAFMQAMGLVNDHLEGCDARSRVESARRAASRPTELESGGELAVDRPARPRRPRRRRRGMAEGSELVGADARRRRDRERRKAKLRRREDGRRRLRRERAARPRRAADDRRAAHEALGRGALAPRDGDARATGRACSAGSARRSPCSASPGSRRARRRSRWTPAASAAGRDGDDRRRAGSRARVGRRSSPRATRGSTPAPGVADADPDRPSRRGPPARDAAPSAASRRSSRSGSGSVPAPAARGAVEDDVVRARRFGWIAPATSVGPPNSST